MAIYLGNLTVKEFLKRTGYKMSNEDIVTLEKHRQDLVEIRTDEDKFHIYDIPFTIVVSPLFKDQLLTILMKYEEQSLSKELLNIAIATESKIEKAEKKQKERDRQYKEQKENPNNIWNIKWHFLIPINNTLYFQGFFNTYTTGYNNIPTTIHGTGWVSKDEEGLHGRFILSNPEKESDADKHLDWNYIIGVGYFNKNNNYIGINDIENLTFEKIDFQLNEAIETHEQLKGNSKEIHLYKEIKDE